jgi:hypothetical protein
MMSEFVRYSSKLGQQNAAGQRPVSAVLRNPAALDGKRLTCGDADPTVLIDLDPGSEAFDPASAGSAPPSFALSLAALREEGVTIVWLSQNSAAIADQMRDALIRSGLDPQSQDQLLLMRYPDDRKQTRRKDLAQQACLIAIAGDQRSDFDELYDYLVNPDAAVTLEPMFGNGWFLISQPQASATPISNSQTESMSDD